MKTTSALLLEGTGRRGLIPVPAAANALLMVIGVFLAFRR